MKKAIKKIVKICLLVILILIITVAVIFNVAGNSIIKNAIEFGGTKVLNVGVAVGDVNLSILKARFSIEDVIVNNPAGYKTDHFIKLGKMVIDTNYGDLMGDTIYIDEITLDGINLTLEQKGLRNNMQDILDNVSKSVESSTQPAEPTIEEPAKPAKKVVIKKLEIKNVSVSSKLPIGGKDSVTTFNIDPIIMTDLGSDEPVDFAVVSAKVMAAIATGVVKQGGGLLPKNFDDAMKGSLNQAGAALEKSKEALSAGVEKGKEAVESLKDTGKSITEGLKGFLPGKKK